MATSPLFGWEEPDDTDLVKDGAAAIRTLGNAIDTSMGDLLGGTTGQVLSKASNTNMDFTWVTSDDANAIQNTIVDAKGDLISATASDVPARLAVGTNRQVLTADSTASTGLAWKQQGLTLLSRTSFSDVASQTFDSVFSSSYWTYFVDIEYIYAATSTNDLQMQLRYGTTTATSGYYGASTIIPYTGTQAITAINNANQITLMGDAGDATNFGSFNMWFNGVGNGVRKPIVQGSGFNNIEAGQVNLGAKQETISAEYTGFLLKSSSTNISGTVSIYGLAIA
jgi:hypothetical protein